MDITYFPAFAGLAGAVVGGFASFATNWLTQQAQLREQKLEKVRRQRESLFVQFMEEASRLYADALGHERDEINDLARLVAIAGHLRMVSSEEIVTAAERVIEAIVEAYHGPNRTLAEMRTFAASGGFAPLRDFSRLSQAELVALRA